MTNLPQIDTDYLVDFLVKLLNIPSPTGFTEDAIVFVEKELSQFEQLELSRTRKGALVAKWVGKNDNAPVALTAHVDTLGAMVKEIKPNGRLQLTRIGGLVLNGVETEGCWVHTSQDYAALRWQSELIRLLGRHDVGKSAATHPAPECLIWKYFREFATTAHLKPV